MKNFRIYFPTHHYLCNQVKEGEAREALTRVGEVRNAYQIFVGKPEVK
jgi:hypothetical protein